jgi:hypothetical protein
MPRNLPDRLSRISARSKLLHLMRGGYLLVRRLLARLGFQLVYASYDSPIPDLNAIEPRIFDEARPMRGIEFDVDRQLEFLERELAEHCREFDPPLSADDADPHRFYLRNGTYESVDAELLYAFVRRFRPARVVELGSGYSTLIIREALQRDGANVPGILRTYDPYRSDLLQPDASVTPMRAQDIPDETFRALGAGDVLFVDTSHVIKVGGDVTRIVLEVLPLLESGVIVHFHDIFLPFPYSRRHLQDAHFWSEQYLLQGFLIGNEAWEVLIGAQALARAHPQRMAVAIPSFSPGVSPGAFWMRRC